MEACNWQITYGFGFHLSLYYLYILLGYIVMYVSVCMFCGALVFLQKSPLGAIGNMHSICRLQRSTVRHTTYAPARLFHAQTCISSREEVPWLGPRSLRFFSTLVGSNEGPRT
jgi:hypothetical protein